MANVIRDPGHATRCRAGRLLHARTRSSPFARRTWRSLRQQVEAALLHRSAATTTSCFLRSGTCRTSLAALLRRAGHGLVGRTLPGRPDAASDRSAVRRLPLGELRHQDEDASRNGTSAARSATAPAASTSQYPVAATIVNPARLEGERADDVCIQCHSQGQPRTKPIGGVYYDWPVGYQPGDRLSDVWALEEHHLGKETFTHWPDGHAHKNRMQGNDYIQSQMSVKGVRCYDCHDVHGTPYRRRPAAAGRRRLSRSATARSDSPARRGRSSSTRSTRRAARAAAAQRATCRSSPERSAT